MLQPGLRKKRQPPNPGSWRLQDAKARFSELLDPCQREGPQVVSRRGRETAVLVPVEEWRRLQAAALPKDPG